MTAPPAAGHGTGTGPSAGADGPVLPGLAAVAGAVPVVRSAPGPPVGAASPDWAPTDLRVREANLSRYLAWLRDERGLALDSYPPLYDWSVRCPEEFWGSIWDYFRVRSADPYTSVLRSAAMPGAEWFPGSTLNYAEHMLTGNPETTALVAARENGDTAEVTYGELRARVGAAQAGLERLGVGKGDRVAAVLPNGVEAVVAMLAAVSMGAVWSVCPPEFGIDSVTDRFAQLAPKVLLVVDRYSYAGKTVDVAANVARLRAALPTVEAVVLVPYQDPAATQLETVAWADLLAEPRDPRFSAVPFDHPLWVLYSSGTTGLPKGIVHGHGGILLEHLKALVLQTDLHPDDRFFWFTTTGWMMWNYLVSGLLAGATVVLYDGSPTHPTPDALWSLAERTGTTVFGTSPAFLARSADAGLVPGRDHALAVHTVCCTGSYLPPEGHLWVLANVGTDVLVSSASGGTDVCTAFVGAVPTMPVRPGQIQTRLLGCDVASLDPDGQPLIEELGELVVTAPMPSMPIGFWGDLNRSRYREAYYEQYPGWWRHGDWITITRDGACNIGGRSDATLNRGGVRMGTAEFYRQVEALPEIQDSLVVDTGELWLFVVLQAGHPLDEGALKAYIRKALSPRHVPDRVVAIPAVPRTLNGKKCEVPVKRILTGVPVSEAVSVDSLTDPSSLAPFIALAPQRAAQGRDLDAEVPRVSRTTTR